MTTAVLDDLQIGPASHFTFEKPDTDLAALTEEMAGLRYSIILSARWEASKSLGAETRSDLKAELGQLRALYSDRLDEIAMRFGIAHAIAAKEMVERNVYVPKGAVHPLKFRNKQSSGA